MIEKIKEMLGSSDMEMRELGMITCKEEFPAVWAALLNFTKPASNDSTTNQKSMEQIVNNAHCNIGSMVKYRGMEFCPTMVVSNVEVVSTQIANRPTYVTKITAKYFNKGNQTFMQVQDRIECFEIIKKKQNES